MVVCGGAWRLGDEGSRVSQVSVVEELGLEITQRVSELAGESGVVTGEFRKVTRGFAVDSKLVFLLGGRAFCL